MSPPPDQNDVSTALRLLRDSLAEEEQRIRNEGAKAMQGGDYDTATSVIEFAKRLLTFQKKVEGLVGEWEELRRKMRWELVSYFQRIQFRHRCIVTTRSMLSLSCCGFRNLH